MSEREPDIEAIPRILQGGVPVRLRCRALGQCMLPGARDDDLITLARADEVRIGDIVVFRGSPLAMHRVVAFAGEQVITKGDLRPDFDPPLSRDQILGRVISIEKPGRTFTFSSRASRTAAILLARYSLLLGRTCSWLSRHKTSASLAHRALALPLAGLRRIMG